MTKVVTDELRIKLKQSSKAVNIFRIYTVKLGKFGHQVNSDTHLQTVEIQMRRLLISRLIRNFTVCLVNFVSFQ